MRHGLGRETVVLAGVSGDVVGGSDDTREPRTPFRQPLCPAYKTPYSPYAQLRGIALCGPAGMPAQAEQACAGPSSAGQSTALRPRCVQDYSAPGRARARPAAAAAAAMAAGAEVAAGAGAGAGACPPGAAAVVVEDAGGGAAAHHALSPSGSRLIHHNLSAPFASCCAI